MARRAQTVAPLVRPATQHDRAAVTAEVAGRRTQRWVTHYAELAPGEAGLMIGSLATLELALRDESLAAAWGVARGAPVRVAVRRG